MLGVHVGLLAEEVKPAGGAALDQIVIASGAALVLTAALLVLGYGHRSGRLPWLERLGAFSSRIGNLPGWAALPLGTAMFSLITALLGMYWDISLHITRGRDEGPLANIAHYPILIGLFGIFTAGVIAVTLPRKGERPGPSSVRITRAWYAPAGAVLVAGSGFYALLGFPLDDVWHRIFGQDVTLWGPTHLMLIGGAGLSLVGMMVLEREGRAATDADPGPRVTFLRRAMVCGGLLIGLSVFQAEYDFGVPQFRLVNQPFLIALAAGCALVAARLWIGRGGAIAAAVFYLIVRGGVSLAVGPVIGELNAAVPMYLAEALIIEAVALFLIRRPLMFGLASGVAVGTLGFAAEYAWTHVAFRLPWTPDMIAEGVLMSVAGGLAGAMFGTLIALGMEGKMPRPQVSRPLFAASLLVVAGSVANGLIFSIPEGTGAQVTMAPDGNATVVFNRPIDDPTWVTATAWQGGGLHVDRMTRVDARTYRTTVPMPVSGEWKTLIRLHDGRDLTAVPVYMPADPAIGAHEVVAEPRFTRPVQDEKLILQRELKDDVPTWVWTAASLVVLFCSLVLVLSLAWGVGRISRALAKDREPVRSTP